MIFVPLLKLGELLTFPVIEPSGFCFHLDRTGMLSFGAAFLTAGALLTGAFLMTGAFFGGAGDPFAPPKRLSVGRPGAGFEAFCTTGAFFGGASTLDPPKNENEGFGAGDGAGSGLGAGLGLPKKEKGAALGAGAGAGLGLPKKEKGSDLGLGVFATALGAGRFFGTDFGATAFGAAGLFLLPPKNDEKASLTGSEVLGAGGALAFGAPFGAGALNNDPRLMVALGPGAGFLATGAGFCALAFGVALGAGASNSDPKLRVGLGFVAGAGATFFGAAFGAAFGA